MRREIAESLEKNRHEMEERLQLTKNFDLVERKLKVGDRDACLYFVDGFVKDEVLEKLMEFFQSLKPELLLENGKAFSRIFVPYVEVEILNSALRRGLSSHRRDSVLRGGGLPDLSHAERGGAGKRQGSPGVQGWFCGDAGL